MPSDLQIETSKKNGAVSNGPKTPEGKARSSRNALKHGLSAKYYVIFHEEQEQFDQLVATFLDEHQPQSQTELDVVHTLAVASWRLRRVRDMESGALNLALLDYSEDATLHDVDETPYERLAGAVAERMRNLESLGRYEARIERSYYRALHELRRLKAERPDDSAPKPEAVEPTQPEPEPAPAPGTAPGFVLSKSCDSKQAEENQGTCPPKAAAGPHQESQRGQASASDRSPGRAIQGPGYADVPSEPAAA